MTTRKRGRSSHLSCTATRWASFLGPVSEQSCSSGHRVSGDAAIPLRIGGIGHRQTSSGEVVQPAASTDRKVEASIGSRTVRGCTRTNWAPTIRLISSSNCTSHRSRARLTGANSSHRQIKLKIHKPRSAGGRPAPSNDSRHLHRQLALCCWGVAQEARVGLSAGRCAE